jgi:peptide/nickel transport system substrate-binding protein
MRRLIALALLAVVLAAPAVADAQKKGGVLKIGNLGEPPSLDPHWGTQTITEVLANHVFEGLYALDDKYQPIPMLAEGMPTVSRDGLTYTIKLRKGVKFHNGKEMTSEDVVPSLVRWSKRSVYGKALFAQVADVKAVDKHTVDLRLKEKSAIVLVARGAQQHGRDLSEGDRREVSPRPARHRVGRHRAVQARGVEA